MFLLINIAIIVLLTPTNLAFRVRNFRNVELADNITTTTARSTTSDDICSTRGCVNAAAAILNKMDEKLDPCDDFYQFSCNNYIKKTIIPDERAYVDVFSETRDKLFDQIKTIITSPIEETDIKPFRNLKKFYQTCMNKGIVEERGLKPVTDIHKEFGGWPVVKGGAWDGSDWSWQQSLKEFHKRGFSSNILFEFIVDSDYKNISKRIIRIDQPNLLPSREYLIKGLDDPIVQAYHSYQVDSAVLYGARQICAELQMKEVLELEFALANISLPSEDRRDFNNLYNIMTIRDLQAKYPFNNWLEYFNALLPSVSQVTEDEIINVSLPSFFSGLAELLEKTPKRTIANYIFWRATESSSLFLSQEIRSRELIYNKFLSGTEKEEPRWKECMDIVSQAFPIATGALYVRKYFNHESQEIATEMTNVIKERFEAILNSVKWMDEATRFSATLKVKNMLTITGYPKELMDDSKLIEYYEQLNINENDYFESVLNILSFETNNGLKKLREPYIKSDWKNWYGAAAIDAYYDMTKNVMSFPAGILQGRFFASDRPSYLNYGAIGAVMGHEISHGFDDQGSQFDLDGMLVNWWKNETKKAFEEKQKCIVEQYGNFSEPSVKIYLNGKNTLGENIADNAGVKVAYHAYKKYITKYGPEQKLPGIKYTPSQLFWISGAQVWCSVFRPEEMSRNIKTSMHSPGQFRVLGTLRNLKEFSKDFNCPIGSPMNPTHKCEIW